MMSKVRPVALLAWALLLASRSVTGAETSPLPQGMANQELSVHWSVTDRKLRAHSVTFLSSARTVVVDDPFALELADGTRITASSLIIESPPNISIIPGNESATRLADRRPHQVAQIPFVDETHRFRILWELELPNGSAYLRERITIRPLIRDEFVARVVLFETGVPDAEVIGQVPGSPIASHNVFFFLESPFSHPQVDSDTDRVSLWVDRKLAIRKQEPVAYSVVVGTGPAESLRRGFQAYLEDTRSHYFRTFLHYNSWYDIGFMTPYTEDQVLDRISTVGQKLVQDRGVKVDGYLLDDGWDDLSGQWRFRASFPQGLNRVRDAARAVGGAPGIWLSPWGGYGQPKAERLRGGQAVGFETDSQGFVLSGPKYYAAFRDVARDLTSIEGVKLIKLDGTGSSDHAYPDSAFDSDFDAALALIEELRRSNADLFVNLTTGTYASPAWLLHADSIWRGGADHGFTGVGSVRQRWITYRDRETYENVVIRGPLFPLSSLMLHGVIFAEHAAGLNTDPGGDFASEVQSYFATGVALQELYITPELLSEKDWDLIAKAARWARANAAILRDSHWVGGDPGRLEVYGWAAWSAERSFVTLRNPRNTSQQFALNIAQALELAAKDSETFCVSDVWNGKPPVRETDAHGTLILPLKPFEVLTLELTRKLGTACR